MRFIPVTVTSRYSARGRDDEMNLPMLINLAQVVSIEPASANHWTGISRIIFGPTDYVVVRESFNHLARLLQETPHG